MKRLLILVVVGLLAGVLPSAVQAQTVAVGELVGPVDLSNPGNATARVKRLSVGAAASAADKFLQGAVRIVPGQGTSGPQVSIEWFGISSDAGGGDTISLAPPLTTRHTPTGTTIPGGRELSVSGDANALVRAVQTISENKQVAAKAAASEGQEEEEESGEKVGINESTGTATQAGSGTPLENSEAKLPTIQAVKGTEKVESVVNTDAYGETAEGCTPVLSDDESHVTIYKAPTKNGIVDGECEATLDTAAVDATYIGCGYEVDQENSKAYAMKRRFYVWGGNTTDVDTECKKDEEKSFQITETAEGCRVTPFLETLEAIQETRLIYVGRENEVQTVAGEGCKVREGGKRFPITQELCSLRDEFDEKRSYERKIATYIAEDGLKRNVGNCTDTGNYYVHHEDTSVCDPLPDYANSKLYKQFRIRIDLPTGPEFRTPTCKPFAEALTDLVETTAGCESFHRDYDGYSLGGKRIIRKDNNAQMRECREADVRYEHECVAEGWVRDDASLQATPQEATYITLPQPAGRTLVAQVAVRTGAEAQGYTFISSRLEEGAPEYIPDSCQKYIKMKKMETWKRPDGSEFVRQNGFGTSQGPIYDCRIEVSMAWTKLRDHPARGEGSGQFWRACNGGNSPGNEHTVYRRNADYRGTKKLIRQGDGVIIQEVTADKTYQYCSGWCRSGGWNPPPCPSPLTDQSKINQWRNELGWW